MKIIQHMISFRTILGIFLTATCSLLTYGAYSWGSYTHKLSLKTIHITGNHLTSVSDYTKYVHPFTGTPIFDIDEDKLSASLESEYFIQAARISKRFPNTLFIELMERTPIAMINTNPIMFIDQNAVVLPAIDKAMEQNLPILSGFNETTNLFPLGKTTLSSKVREGTKIITHIQNSYPIIYNNISEFRLNNHDEFEIILLEKPTLILLGQEDIYKKLAILDQFQHTLSSKRLLTDYSMINLRYNNQVVVRERRS